MASTGCTFHNSLIFVPNFFASSKTVSAMIRTSSHMLRSPFAILSDLILESFAELFDSFNIYFQSTISALAVVVFAVSARPE